MNNLFEELDRILEDAEKSASLETASFGFPQERVEIKKVHIIDCAAGGVGDVVHPTEYIKRMVKLHHESWIIRPIREARSLLSLHKELIDGCCRMKEELDMSELFRLAEMLKHRSTNT